MLILGLKGIRPHQQGYIKTFPLSKDFVLMDRPKVLCPHDQFQIVFPVHMKGILKTCKITTKCFPKIHFWHD